MIKLLINKLLCCHNWEEKHRTRLWEKSSDKEEGGLPVEERCIFICKKCGKIKKIEL